MVKKMNTKKKHYPDRCDWCGQITPNLICAKLGGKHIGDICTECSPNNPSGASCFELFMKKRDIAIDAEIGGDPVDYMSN